jgi:S-formylglutathione hydrolase FrmB
MPEQFTHQAICHLRTRGRVIKDHLVSQVLSSNPLADPAERDLLVYLPPSYERSPGQRYPVVFALADYSGSDASLQNWLPFQPTLSDQLDLLRARGLLGVGLIIVMPDCFTSYEGSQYANSPAVGHYDDYLVEELFPYIDRTYRTLGEGRRGIFGKSSGGYGALRGGVCCILISGVPLPGTAATCSSSCAMQAIFPPFARSSSAGGLEALYKAFLIRMQQTEEDMIALNVIAMAACYSPDPELAPFPFRLPFDLKTCERLPDVWERWQANDPVRMVEDRRVQEAQRSLKLLYFDCGSRDQYQLHFGARLLGQKLIQAGILYEYEEFDDDHTNIAYRYNVSLPKFAQVLRQGTT